MDTIRDRPGIVTALLIILIFASISAPIGVAETYIVPPLYAVDWAYTPDIGFVFDYKWSPQGDLLAVGIHRITENSSSKIIIFYSNGSLFWETDDLGEPLGGSVAWSYDARYIAVPLFTSGVSIIDLKQRTIEKIEVKSTEQIQWAPINNDVLAVSSRQSLFLLDKTGSILWRYTAGEQIKGISWNPSGSNILVRTSHKLILLDINGIVNWVYEENDNVIDYAEWSRDGDFIALQIEDKGVLILDKSGKEISSINISPVYRIQWSPVKDELLIAGFNLILYSIGNGVIWETKWVKGIAGSITPYYMSWSPNGELIAVAKDGYLIFVNSSNGKIIWKDIITEKRFEDISWSPAGDYLSILLGGKHGTLVVFGKAGEFGIVKIENCHLDLLCTIAVNDGLFQRIYPGTPNGTVIIYATPGNYTITFMLGSLPRDYNVVGDLISYGMKFNSTQHVIVRDSEGITLEVPVDKIIHTILENLGVVEIRGPVGATVVFKSTGAPGIWRVTLESKMINVYIVPGEYELRYYVGNKYEQKDLGKIAISPGETAQIVIPYEHETETTTTTTKIMPSTTITSRTTSTLETGITTTTTSPQQTENPQSKEGVVLQETGSSKTLFMAIGIAVVILLLVLVLVMVRR